MSQLRSGRFEHFTYWQGQTLRSRDFRDQLNYADAHRAWHNRAVHASFGVSIGLGVRFEAHHVDVACGLAYDCLGREVVLQETRTIGLPHEQIGQLLLLVLVRRPLEPGRVPVEAGTELRWVPVSRFRPQIGVPLARVLWNAGQYEEAFDEKPRLAAFRPLRVRALARLPMATGTLEGARISWEPLLDKSGLEVRVDTSTAGFVSEKVLYFASLLWEKPNRRFAPPFASVLHPNERGFTLRLLLPHEGAEAFEVIQGAGLVEKTKRSTGRVEFRRKVHFHADQDFIADDVVARLAPRSDRAWPLSSIANDRITLNDPDGDASFEVGDLVVAANLPRSVIVTQIFDAFQVRAKAADDLEAIKPGDNVVREGGTAAGSAARVGAKQGPRLWLESAVLDLAPNERLCVLGAPHVIASVSSGQNPLINFTDNFEPPSDAVVIRVADNTGAPVEIATQLVSAVLEVTSTNNVHKCRVDGGLGLKKEESVAFAVFADHGFEIESVAAATGNAIEVNRPELLLKGDVVKVAGTPDASAALVLGIDGTRATLSVALDAVGEVLEIADLTDRSTVESTNEFLGPSVTVAVMGASRAFFASQQVMVRVGGASSETSVVQLVFQQSVFLVPPIADVGAGDVLAVARFARRAEVQGVVAGAPFKVTVDTPSVFAIGDTVAREGTASTTTLSRIDDIQGSTLVLRTAISGLATGQKLAVVCLRGASAVIEAGDETLTVDPSDNFRQGDLVGRFTGWRDVTLASTLDGNTLRAWLDGLLPRDALGFAALSSTQKQLRFASSAGLQLEQQLRLLGVDATTGQDTTRDALVTELQNGRATLEFISGSNAFEVRPEDVMVTGILAQNVPARFAAYTLEQGLRIAWLGCQLPAAPIETCPLHAVGPCTCCNEAPVALSTPSSSSGCCQ